MDRLRLRVPPFVATFKCLNITNQWTHRTFIFIFFVTSYFYLYGKCLNNTNQWTDGTLWFASPLGSLWAPLGLQVAHFWSPLAPFWFTLVPFVSLLAPFGSLSLTLGILFEEIMKTFINSIHFHKCSRLVNNVYELSYFSRHRC